MKSKLKWIITITSIFVLLLSTNLVNAEEVVDKGPYYNGVAYPDAAFNKGIEPPYSLNSNSEESIDPATGAINIKVNDISLKGRNGLDFSLSRYYTQNNGVLYEPFVSSYPVYTRYHQIYGYAVECIITEYKVNNAIGTYTSSSTRYNRAVFDTRSEAQAYLNLYNNLPDKYGSVYIENGEEYYNITTYDAIGTFEVYEIIDMLLGYEYYINTGSGTSNDKYSDLGAGWAFDLPYIEEREGYKYLHYGSAGTWQIDLGTSGGQSHLKNYPLIDLKLNADNNSYSNGQKSSSYVLEQKDGKKTYFGSDGRLLGIKDRFNNEIRFQHDTSRTRYPIINKIIDSVGREINITYSASQVVITINDETNSNNKRIIKYNKTAISGESGKYVLDNVIDPENKQTKYQYSINSANINLTKKNLNEGIVNKYVCLTKIIMPTNGETHYSYTKSTKNCGTDGVMEVYKLNERYESKNDGVNYNYKKFNYLYGATGEYDGYPNYSSDAAIPATYNIKTQVLDGFDNSDIYTFNKKLLPINIIQEGTNHKNETINEYDATKNLLIKTVNKRYNKVTGAFVKNVDTYEYDTSGYRDMLVHWDSHGTRDSNDMPTSYTRKISYEYEPTYHYIVRKLYTGASSKTIMESYIPTSDSKAIEWIKIYENAGLVSQTWYNYDTYGNIIEERRYLNNTTTPISTYFSYNDNNSARNGKFNGAYLTRKWNNNVKNIDEVEDSSSGITVDETFKYDWYGNTIEIKDGNGYKNAYEYDKLGRVIKETHQDGTYKTLQYTTNSSENSVIITDENKNKIKNLYDRLGNIMYQVDVASGQYLSQYTYDSQMRLKTESNQNTSPSYSIITYNYDSAGRLLEKSTKDQQDYIIAKENYNYEDAVDGGDGILYNKVTKTILGDANSPSITLVEYRNNLDQVVKSGALHNGTEYLDTFKYDYLGNKIEEKSARAYDEYWSQTYTTKYEYNYQSKTLKQYNIIGDFVSNTYDKLGRLEKVTDIKGNKNRELIGYLPTTGAIIWGNVTPYSTTYEYDNLGRVIKETIPFDKASSTIINSVKKHYYDRNGNKIEEKVLSNNSGEIEIYNTTRYEYNNRNMLTTVITYDNGEPENYTQYYYDAVGNKVRMYTGLSAPLTITGLDKVTPTSDSEYSVTKYEYDRFGRLTKMTDPMNMDENYTYDLNGNLLQKIDKNGSIITMTYDGMGRLLTKTVVNKENPLLNASYSYTYTLTGNKKTMSGGGTNTTYYYDDLGRLIKEVVSDGSQKEYTYDAANNRKSLKISQNGVVKAYTTYTYDNLNRLNTVKENGVLTATYTYDDNGNRNTLTYANGNTTEYQYNLANKLTQLTNKKGTEVLSSYAYTYYLNGNQAAKTDNTGKVTAYTYDGLGRITSESPSGEAEITYTYDDSNNRQTMTVGEIVTSYEYDKNNRLLTEAKNATDQTTEITQYYYDNNGNTLYKALETISSTTGVASSLEATTSDEERDLTINEYNGFNQLIKTQAGSTTAEYAYNADGLRTSKTVNGVKTNHVWDGDQIALETNASGNVTSKYVRGINLLYAENATGTKQYYLFNGHGDVVQLTGASGIVTKNYDYDAFGNEKNLDENDTNVFRYCGEYFDKETGTIYLRARYYDPTIGRFTAEDTHWNPNNMIYGDNPVKINERQDPLGLTIYTYAPDINAIKQSTNLYAYCGNNPIMYIDADGEAWILIGAGVGALIGGGFDIYKQIKSGASWKSLDWKSIGISAGAGAISGALGATGVGLLGQIAGNAAISGAESALKDLVSGNRIDWKKAAINTGIGAFAGGLGGPGLKNVSRVTYGTIVSQGGKLGVYTFTYTSSRMAETMAREFIKGIVKGIGTQITIEVIGNKVQIISNEK